MQEQQSQVQPFEGMPEAEHQEHHYKTLAVRVEEGLHAQLRFIAQLAGSSIAEEIRRSIEARVATAQDDPELVARAEQVRSEIEREAAARREAIAGFLGMPAAAAATGDNPARRGRAPRRGSETGDGRGGGSHVQ